MMLKEMMLTAKTRMKTLMMQRKTTEKAKMKTTLRKKKKEKKQQSLSQVLMAKKSMSLAGSQILKQGAGMISHFKQRLMATRKT